MKFIVTIFTVLTCTSFLFAVDTTFIIAGDTHYGRYLWDSNEENNKQSIEDMNVLQGIERPDGSGETIEDIKGVVVVGDLTDNARFWEWFKIPLPFCLYRDGFTADYGLTGDKKLHYPVFEGYGNHDVSGSCCEWVLDDIKKRNNYRGAELTVSGNGYHYSWEWNGIRFFQLNLYPGVGEDCKESLAFLTEELAKLEDPATPIILFHHYAYDTVVSQGSDISPHSWTEDEKDVLYDVIKSFNILAIFNGHYHSMQHIKWRGIDTFITGSVGIDKEYLLCRITDTQFQVMMRRDGQWAGLFEKAL